MANKLLPLGALLPFLAVCAFAQTATTTPVGFMRFTVAAGTPATPATTAIAIPLHDVGIGALAGVSSGKISAVSSNSVTVASAGWTANSLSAAAIPFAIYIKSGTAEGTMMKITANTDTVLTLDAANLPSLGFAAGDSFEIIPLDTLGSFFGANTLIGDTTPTKADVVYIMSAGLWTGYYYNTNLKRWVTKTGPQTIRDNIVLQPGSGVLIERRGQSLDLVVTGTVSTTKYRYSVANSGNTLVHTGFPTDSTLGALSLQTLLPGWVSSPTAATADWVYIMQSGLWTSYYYTKTKWCTTTGPQVPRDSITIPAGTPILLFKKGTASGSSVLQRPLPYSL